MSVHRKDGVRESRGVPATAAGAARGDDGGPKMAALLVLQPVGLQATEYARLARGLMAAGCRRLDNDNRTLVAEFSSALEALDLALRLLNERGNGLRAALSVGAVERVDKRLAGLAVTDARNALRFAGPGSLALGSRLTPSMIEDVRPGLAHLLRPVTATGREVAPMAFVVEAAALATMRGELMHAASLRRRFRGERRTLAIVAGALLLATIAWLAGRVLLREGRAAHSATPAALAAAADRQAGNSWATVSSHRWMP